MAMQVHTVYNHPKGVWENKYGGSNEVLSEHSTKKEAREKGIKIAKKEKAEFYLHNKNGVISEKNSYGNDPRSIKDKDGKNTHKSDNKAKKKVSGSSCW